MVNKTFIPVIGLVGGVGCGKSSVARKLSDTHSIVVIDGDRAGHRVLTQSKIKAQIKTQFGESVFQENGDVDRAALGQLVFGTDDRHRLARSQLESIVHPEIYRQLKQEIQEAQSQESADAVILDAAIMLEAGWDDLCDTIVFVDTPLENRLARVSSRGWDADRLAQREASQWPLSRKRGAANYVINNSQHLDEAASELGLIVTHIIENHLP